MLERSPRGGSFLEFNFVSVMKWTNPPKAFQGQHRIWVCRHHSVERILLSSLTTSLLNSKTVVTCSPNSLGVNVDAQGEAGLATW